MVRKMDGLNYSLFHFKNEKTLFIHLDPFLLIEKSLPGGTGKVEESLHLTIRFQIFDD